MRKTVNLQPTLQEPWLQVEHAKELAEISKILDEDPRFAELVAQDLREATGARSDTGARGMSGEQVLRALLVKQINGFSYRELVFHLEDSRSYRKFCRLGVMESAPSKSALAANIKSVRAESLERLNRLLVQAALAQGVEKGRKVRVDATVVESNIHHPTDSELLWDGVRVLVRFLKKARAELGAGHVRFHDRTRRARRRRKQINDARFQRQRVGPYRDLLEVADETLGYATDVREVLRGVRAADPVQAGILAVLAEKLDRYLPLVQRVIDQTRRRVLEGESVPASEKVVSIFEPHTDIICKGGRETFYGHKICITGGASSMVLDCVVLAGNPPDSTLAIDMVERQRDILGRLPHQVAFDGAFASKRNLAKIKKAGVRDVVFAKKQGLQISEMAKSCWVYKRLRNFRAGIEGVISLLKRAFGLARCTWRSLPSFESYVWSSVLACNLMLMARHRMA